MTKLEPIDLSSNPTMPAPWSGDLPGETWIAGDYYAIFAQNCVWVIYGLEEMAGKPMRVQGFHFVHCLHVFSRSLHSLRPVLCLSVERANYRGHPLVKDIGMGPGGDGLGPEVLEIYTNSIRRNMGELPPNITREAARKRFFELWKSECNLSEEPSDVTPPNQAT